MGGLDASRSAVSKCLSHVELRREIGGLTMESEAHAHSGFGTLKLNGLLYCLRSDEELFQRIHVVDHVFAGP